MKTCTKCKETKPLTEFSKRRDAKDGLQRDCKACKKAYSAAWYQANREARLIKDKEYREANRDKIAEYQREHYKTNKDRISNRNKAWRIANPEKVKARSRAYHEENKERANEYSKAYYRENKDKNVAKAHRRRARAANALGSHTAEQWQARLDYFGNKCRYCGSTESLHCDHQIPLSRGGSNYPSNLAPACQSCNLSKGTKTHLEYLECLNQSDGN